MKPHLSDQLNDPQALERLYRENRREFTRAFAEVPDDHPSQLVKFWKIRLAADPGQPVPFSMREMAEVLLIALVTALLVKLPALFPGIHEETYYTRNLAVIVFNGVILFFLRKNRIGAGRIVLYGAATAVLLLYLNLLPRRENDVLQIAIFHGPMLLWFYLGAAFVSFNRRDYAARIAFIRFNGELMTMTGLLLITGGILTAVTIGLYEAIGSEIEDGYINYVVIPGSSVAPLLAAWLIRLYPDITRRIVPVIARVFTPVVLITLVIYLVSLAFSGARILKDRNLLILFNMMLVAVTAIIVFSITELDKQRDKNPHILVLLALALVTLVINTVALTAIAGRLAQGITPNRVVVIATNLMVFVNLILISKDLIRSWYQAGRLNSVERTVAGYLPVYFFWALFAIFILPALFGYR